MPKIDGIHYPKAGNTNNIFINGDMTIAQRQTTFSSIADGTYTADRWRYLKAGAGVHTVTVDTDVPTVAQVLAATGQGYVYQNSLRLNLTTPDTSIAAGDVYAIGQRVEGYNWVNLAQKITTLSFWVKATQVGTYCISFLNFGDDRSYVAEYTVNVTNTWEYKTITIPASPSAGTWRYDNTGSGIKVHWTVAAGTTFQTTTGAWQTGGFYATANQVNGTNTGATDFRITGAMFNAGAVAAPFKLFAEDFQEEIHACQRYFEKSQSMFSFPGAVDNGGRVHVVNQFSAAVDTPHVIQFKVTKRTTPTVLAYSASAGGASGYATPDNVGVFGGTIFKNVASNTAWDAHWTADAEL